MEGLRLRAVEFDVLVWWDDDLVYGTCETVWMLLLLRLWDGWDGLEV